MQAWRRENAARMNNLAILSPSTPAQYFHLLRRQAKSHTPKPIVVLTPKSTLHHGPCRSDLCDFEKDSRFQLVLPHVAQANDVAPEDVRRVLMCTGQVYWRLIRARRSSGAQVTGAAWVTAVVEPFDQLSPLALLIVVSNRTWRLCALSSCHRSHSMSSQQQRCCNSPMPNLCGCRYVCVFWGRHHHRLLGSLFHPRFRLTRMQWHWHWHGWCMEQQEPQNMGFWDYIAPRVRAMVRLFDPARQLEVFKQYHTLESISRAGGECGQVVRFIGRPAATCATGSFHVHTAEERLHVLEPAFE